MVSPQSKTFLFTGSRFFFSCWIATTTERKWINVQGRYVKGVNLWNCCDGKWLNHCILYLSIHKSAVMTQLHETNLCSSSLHRQMAGGRMLPPLHQWHRQQKDPGAFIRILPTEYIHLCASPPPPLKKKINLDWCCYSQYLTKEFPVPQFERYCEILNRLKRKRKKKKRKFLLLTTFGIQTKIFTMKI